MMLEYLKMGDSWSTAAGLTASTLLPLEMIQKMRQAVNTTTFSFILVIISSASSVSASAVTARRYLVVLMMDVSMSMTEKLTNKPAESRLTEMMSTLFHLLMIQLTCWRQEEMMGW